MQAPRRLQLRRGNTAAVSTYLGAPGELIVNTDTNTLYLHDGVTVGGTATTVNTASITGNISSLQANVLILQGNIVTLTSNAAVQAGILSTLLANAGVQSGDIAGLLANAGVQSGELATLTANAASQAGILATLTSNAASQSGALADLVANAAVQAGLIASSTGTYSNANVKTYLSTFDGNVLPSANVTYSLGSSTRQWKDLFVSNNTIYIGGVPLSIDATGTLLVNGNLVTGSGTYTNSNVASYLSTGNVTLGNVTIQDNYSQQWQFRDGALIWPAGDGTPTGPYIEGSSLMTVYPNNDGEFRIQTYSTTAVGSRQWKFNSEGNLTIPDDGVIRSDLDVRVFAEEGNIALGNQNGTWMFGADGRFTAPGDVYGQYFTVRGGGSPGDEIGSLGYGGNIIELYGTNGVRISAVGEGGPLWQFNTSGNLTIPGGGIVAGSTYDISLIAGNDGNATAGTINITTTNPAIAQSYNWQFNSLGELELPQGGLIKEGGGPFGSSITLEPANITDGDQTLLIYPTAADGNHLHLTTGNLYNTEMYLGSDDYYVKLANTGNVEIRADDNQGSSAQWIFNRDSTTTFPTGLYFAPMGEIYNTSGTATFGSSNYDVNIYANVDGTAQQFNFGTDGNLILPQTNMATSPAPSSWPGITFSDGTFQKSAYGNTNVTAYFADGTAKTFTGNLSIEGNLFVNGNATFISTNSYVISDNILSIADGNPADTLDLGFTAHRTTATGLQHTGLIRDASANTWRLFSNVIVSPGTTADFTDAVYDAIQVGAITSPTVTDIYANLGGVSGSLATLTANAGAQSASIATLTANAATQAGDIATLYANAGAQSGSLATITANLGSVAGSLATLTSNAAVQAGLIADLTSNAAVQAGLIANISSGTTYSNTNVAAYLSTATITTTGNITAAYLVGNISVTGNVTGTSPNVTLQAGSYSSVFNNQGNVILPNLAVTGNVISGGYFLGNGALLTGIIASAGTTYSNTNVQYYLTSNTITTAITTTGNIATTQYVNATYFTGNGALLTGIVAGSGTTYSNSNVASYLPTYSGNLSAGGYFGLAGTDGTTVVDFQTGAATNQIITLGSNYTFSIKAGAAASNRGSLVLESGQNTRVRVNGSSSNVQITAGNGVQTSTWLFSNSGVLTFPDSTTMSTSYGNTQVASYLPTYSGNVSASYFIGNITNTTGNVFTVGNAVIGVSGYTALPTTVAQFTGNANTYVQLNVQNINSGTDATSEYVATANNGTDTTFFVDLGIANSNYDVNSPNNSLGTAIYANDSYLYAQGNTSANVGGNLAIGTSTAGKSVKIFAGGVNSGNIIATVSNTGLAVTGNVTATNNITATGNVTATYIVTTGGFGNISQVDTITANAGVYSGNITVSGSAGVIMPNRSAFRVNGTGLVTQTTSNVNLKGAAISTVFNQGSYFDATTGKFTAPVAGIYQVSLVARVNTNSTSQIAVLKNGLNSGGNIVCFWEADASTGTATHFGTSGTVVLAAGDYLSANILLGNVTFDGNDNWCVTYLG